MLAQVSKQDVLPVAFVVVVPEVIAGMTQVVRQFATWELQDIMQFVVVDVSGVESPVSGGATLGTVVCASTSSGLVQSASATIRSADPNQAAPLRLSLLAVKQTAGAKANRKIPIETITLLPQTTSSRPCRLVTVVRT